MLKYLVCTALLASSTSAFAQNAFNWRKHEGETNNLMLNNIAWAKTAIRGAGKTKQR